jgi:protein-S-isoprenylcysteine O-methyltransferase Ste14
MLWLRTALFALLIPGTELVLVPCILVRHLGAQFDLGRMRWLGLVLLVPGLAMITWCFLDFIRRGRGTPAPYDPPRRLVIAGLYRYVRNPQYIGVVLVLLSEALFFGSFVLFGYAAFFAIGYHLFVRFYEEPTLKRLFGEDYIRYSGAVPRWIPNRGVTYFKHDGAA